MGGKQSGHNDISPTKLNGIHHKVVINTDRVERIDSTDYNKSCNFEMNGMEIEMVLMLGMMLMMISMMPVMMVTAMATISPSGRCSPWWRWLFFSVDLRHEAAAKLRNSSSFRILP